MSKIAMISNNFTKILRLVQEVCPGTIAIHIYVLDARLQLLMVMHLRLVYHTENQVQGVSTTLMIGLCSH